MKLVMIGHGMVGHKFIESVLEHAGDDIEITILAEEPRLAYDRVHLTEYFTGKSAKEFIERYKTPKYQTNKLINLFKDS